MHTISEQASGQQPTRSQRMRRKRQRSRRERREELIGYLFASPIIIGIITLAAYPFLASFYYSFTDYNIIQPPYWTGLQNYHDLFADPLFWLSLKNTLIYSAVVIPLNLICALGLAVLLKQKLRTIGFFRALVYLPSVIPSVAATILWLWILNPQYGVLNNLLGSIGITGPDWINNPAWTKPSLILMSLWGIGPAAIIFLAGLHDIPEALYEAARIDGAGRIACFRFITIRLVTPTLFFNLVLGVIGTLQTFNEPYIFGGNGGGPANSILMYVVYLYQTAFRDFQMGYASAMSIILFIVILILTLIVTTTSRRWVYYEAGQPK
ncbi:spermidine/putrescine ABC transporter permease [Dictyobacter sp. S3.2.2.5]|uniref:Spermidine/putrescine ABC transporter permease n=1 Tax=Dictyobacter halimunensis TaxID=3026934 RepID=A0ABQ6FJ27_9CHLR|nr:spermidine/putrescine ABC transporter permease [Dictyobacter sp. S3.2.2.5]